MKSLPLVSVLVPTYNGARHLDAALASIRRQSYRHLEVIIRDDGSSDDSAAIARSYADRDRRFTVQEFDGRRLGGTGNMVELLGLATGEYVKYLHQDDLLHPACVERLVRPMRFDGALTLSTSTRTRIDGSDQPVVDSHPGFVPLFGRNGKFAGDDIARQMITSFTNQLGEPSVALFRNGVVEPSEAFTLDGVTYSYINDMALWANLLCAGDGYWHVEPLSTFRVHGGQRSAQLAENVTLAGELTTLVRFGIRAGHVRTTDEFLTLGRYATALIGRVSASVAAEPVGEARVALEKQLTDVVATLRDVIAEGAAAFAHTPAAPVLQVV